MSKDKTPSCAIEAVEQAPNGREAMGAYIEQFRKEHWPKLEFLFGDDEAGQPYLNHATKDMLDTLAQLTVALVNHVAVNIATIRRQDAAAEDRSKH